jgi:ribonuclease HI
MYRTNEANLNAITDNLEQLRECFGKWVNLSIVSDCKVVVTSSDNRIFKRGRSEVKLGELCEDSSREVTEKIYAGKKLKARMCDFRPSFLDGFKKDPEVMISIWEY